MQSRAAVPQQKILIVDDNAQNRALFEMTLLQDDNYEVVLARSGSEAIDAFTLHCPDCVLLDVRMPGMDGFTVCERIRALPHGEDVPIIFLTAMRDLETFEHAQRAGGDDFLTKPVQPQELRSRVTTALKIRRFSRDLREHLHLVRQQRDDLMRLQLQKEQLLSFVVHDLKNPLNGIGLAIQSLLRDPNLSQRSNRSVEVIRSGSRQMQRLILNLLDIGRAEEGQLVVRPARIDTAALFAEVAGAQDLEICGLKVETLIERGAAVVRADRDLLQRVLENLLDNSIRYAPEGSTIRLTAKAVAGVVEIWIADDGPGVPGDLRERIFERYIQAADRDTASRGLGLAFCKLAVQAHGGSIQVEGPGSAFCIRLPNEP